MKAKRLIFIGSFSIVFLMIFVSPVLAQAGGVFQEIFKAIAGENFDMAQFYSDYGNFIDFLIYLTVFISVAMQTLGDKFKNKGGKGVVIAVGVALAVALSSWGTRNGFTLRSFGPVAGGIFMIIVFYGMFNLIKNFFDRNVEGKSIATVAAFILVWYLANAVSPALITWLTGLQVIGPMLSAGVSVALIALLILLVMHFTKGSGKGFFSRWFGGKTTPNAPDDTPPNTGGADQGLDGADEVADEEAQVNQAENEKIKKMLKKLGQILKRFRELSKGKTKFSDFTEDLKKDLEKLSSDMEELGKLEKIEWRDEKLIENLGISKSANAYKLLKDEKDMLNAFRSLINDAYQEIGANKNYQRAVSNFQHAENVLRNLIVINSKERKNLK